MRFLNRCSLVAVLLVFCITAQAFAKPKGAPRAVELDVRTSEVRALPAGGCETIQYHTIDPLVYIWNSPDTFGDTMQFVRFTPSFTCTLKTVQIWLADTSAGAVGTPGVTIDIYTAVGGFPGVVLASMSLPYDSLIFFQTGPTVVDFSSLNLVFNSDYCVVMRRFGTAADTLALLSDTSVNGNLRSGEFTLFGGLNDWEFMVDGWGIDIDFFVTTTMCCEDPPACAPGAQASWPTMGGSVMRTHRSNASISNECRLTVDWISQPDTAGATIKRSEWSNVVVSDTLAFLNYYDYLACFDVRTGAELWRTPTDSFPLFGVGMRGDVTVDDSLVYVGGGTYKSFNCLRVADGSVKWTINPLTSPSIGGNMLWAPSFIKDSIIYFATDVQIDAIFAVNKYTGALFSGWSTNPISLTEGQIWKAFSSDNDSLLFAGTFSGLQSLTLDPLNDGRLYAIRLSDGTIKWELEDPTRKTLGNATLDQEGFTGTLAYENGILYYQSNIRDDASGFDHFPSDGGAGAIDVNLEDGSGAGILWVAPDPVGRAYLGGPVIGEGVVYLGCDGIFASTLNPEGIIALNKANGSRLWHNPLDDLGVPVPLTLTCEAGTNPYLFAGTRGGRWFAVDGFTGDVIWSRTFTGFVHSTVVLDSQVLVSTQTSLLGNRTGQLLSFKLSAADRPRMSILQLAPFATNALPGSGNTTLDTMYSALANVGCADLTISSFGIDTATLSARVMSVEPGLSARANRLADRLASDYLSFTSLHSQGPGIVDLKQGLLRKKFDTPYVSDRNAARHWMQSQVTASAVPVIAVENIAPVTVVAGDSLNIELRIDETGQTPRTTTRNYIVLNTNDPDFFPEDTSYGALGSPIITVDAIFGFASELDTIRTMDALTFVTNHGKMGVEAGANFFIDPDGAGQLYDGSFIVSGKIANVSRTAWDVYDWAEFQPNGFLSIVRDTAVGTYGGLDTLTATIAQSNYVDSIGFPDSVTTYAYGVEISETQIGFNLAGQGIGSFKLVQQCVINRSATPVDSVLYLGAFIDWDVLSGNNNVDTTHATAWSTIYQYDPATPTSMYGLVKLPAPGASYKELDGTMHTGAGFYSVYAVFNPDEVYATGSSAPLVDSIHAYMETPGFNSRGGFNRASDPATGDMSMAVAFDTVHLAANETTYVRYAVFGSRPTGTLNDEAADIARAANREAGFRRGDVNGDGDYNFLDLIYLYKWVNSGQTTAMPVPRALNGDVNGDDMVDMADVTYLENYLYGMGPAPIGQWWW